MLGGASYSGVVDMFFFSLLCWLERSCVGAVSRISKAVALLASQFLLSWLADIICWCIFLNANGGGVACISISARLARECYMLVPFLKVSMVVAMLASRSLPCNLA